MMVERVGDELTVVLTIDSGGGWCDRQCQRGQRCQRRRMEDGREQWKMWNTSLVIGIVCVQARFLQEVRDGAKYECGWHRQVVAKLFVMIKMKRVRNEIQGFKEKMKLDQGDSWRISRKREGKQSERRENEKLGDASGEVGGSEEIEVEVVDASELCMDRIFKWEDVRKLLHLCVEYMKVMLSLGLVKFENVEKREPGLEDLERLSCEDGKRVYGCSHSLRSSSVLIDLTYQSNNLKNPSEKQTNKT